jgi:salicylate hydroxylase
MHRVDLQRAMVRRCRELGIEVRLNARATDVDFEEAAVTLEDGTTVQGDVVLLADGLWSSIRGRFLGRPSPAVLTGDLAFRIVLDVSELHGPHKQELAEFIASSTVNFWAGPHSHAVSYTMRAGQVLNIVLLCPDTLPEGVAKEEGDLEEMKKLFKTWDPLLRKLLEQVKSVHKWRLMWLDALPEWANPSGTFFMAGDCCHPMLPYLAQGANSSLEDGAVLGHLLGKVRGGSGKKQQLPKVAAMYQRLRMERGRLIQRESFKQRDDFHMPDGREQEVRDALMLGMLGKELKPDFPSRWTCPRIQPFLYSYDAYNEAEKMFRGDPF